MKRIFLVFLVLTAFVDSVYAKVDLLLPEQNPDNRVVYSHSTNKYGDQTIDIRLVKNEHCEDNYKCFHGYSTDWANYSDDSTYRGCGRHAARHFVQWYGKNPTMHNTRAYVRGTEFHDPTSDPNPIFTTPAQMSVGLENLLKAYRPGRTYSLDELNTIRHFGGSRNTLIEQFTHHLKRGTPVNTLIHNGNHWVTVTGISYTQLKNGDYRNIYFYFKDNYRDNSESYSDMVIRDWDTSDVFYRWVTNVAGYTSYKAGTLVSLKTDEIIYQKKWSKGWSGKIFKVAQGNNKTKQFLLLFKRGNGTVRIHNVNQYGAVGTMVKEYHWSSGWTQMEPFTQGNQSYILLLKKGNGLVKIHKLNTDGTVGSLVKEYHWSSGWQLARVFNNRGTNYLLLNKYNGLTHLHKMNSNGMVGAAIVKTAHGFMEGMRDIAIMTSPNSAMTHFYGVNPKTGNFRHAYHTLQTNKNFSHVENKSWSRDWSQIATYPAAYGNKCMMIAKAGFEVSGADLDAPHNGLVHMHKLNSSYNVSTMTDTNYFKNSVNMHAIAKAWSNMQFFRATNGKLNLFMLDKYSGNVRILEMHENCTFKGGSLLYKTLEN